MSSRKSSVSVIVPCWNVAPYITRCIRSVINQTHPPDEIICVDDGSTDDTVARIEGLQGALPIQLIRTQHGGAPRARNIGLRNARADYLQFLDADDYLGSRKLEHQLELLDQLDPSPDLIIADHFQQSRFRKKRRRTIRDDIWAALVAYAVGNLGKTSANLWKRSMVQAVGGWREDLPFGQEKALILDMMKSGACWIADDVPLTYCLTRQGSITSRWTGVQRVLPELQLRREAFCYLKEHDLLTPPRAYAWHTYVARRLRKLMNHPDLAKKAVALVVYGKE